VREKGGTGGRDLPYIDNDIIFSESLCNGSGTLITYLIIIQARKGGVRERRR
jgi:hypothetical protein